MPTFFYVAKSSPEKVVQGNLDAASKDLALEKLFQMGYYPLRIDDQETVAAKKVFSFRKKIPKNSVLQFTREISDLLDAKIPLSDAMELVHSQFAFGAFRDLLGTLKNAVKSGESFSDALRRYPKLFPPLYISLVKAGESAGVLDQALLRLANFLEEEAELKSKLVATLIYPVFVLGVGMATVLFLVFFVVPRLSQMFSEVGQSLPPLTLWLIRFSRFGLRFGWILLLLLFLAGAWMKRMQQEKKERIKLVWDRLLARIPFWDEMTRLASLSHFARTLSMLLSHGVPILESLSIAESTVHHPELSPALAKLRENVQSGARMGETLSALKIFPLTFVHLVTIGESTGRLDAALLKLSKNYERQMSQRIKWITSLLEPLLILMVGLIVGLIVLSMLLPIFEMNTLVR